MNAGTAAPSRRPRRLSLPHEHGAWLTLAGSILVGVTLGGGAAPALGLSLALAAAYAVRGPAEQLGVGREARWDRLAVAAFAAVALGGAWLASRAGWPFALAAAAAFPISLVVASLARRTKQHRHPLLEMAGMGALGASAGLVALAGGARLGPSILVGAALGVHALVTVPVVRTELRPGERARRPHADFAAALSLLACALVLIAAGHPWVAAALAPRALHLVLRRAGLLELKRPALIGARETILLALTALIAALAALAA